MKIELNRDTHEIELNQISGGACFLYEDILYMKLNQGIKALQDRDLRVGTSPFPQNLPNAYNAVRLSDGALSSFRLDSLVGPYEAKVVSV